MHEAGERRFGAREQAAAVEQLAVQVRRVDVGDDRIRSEQFPAGQPHTAHPSAGGRRSPATGRRYGRPGAVTGQRRRDLVQPTGHVPAAVLLLDKAVEASAAGAKRGSEPE